jgi:erythromycin esterase-like protein
MRSILFSLVMILTLSSTAQLIPTATITPIDKREKYLDSLVAMIGNKRIVAIGEDTHGTGDFYDLRAAITQRLIRQKGFTTVILENPHEDMMALQDQLAAGNLDTLMRKHLFEIYQSKEMRQFLVWFRKQAAKQKNLKLAGCDDSYRELLPQYLQQAVARYHDSSLNSMCRELLLRQTLSVKEFYQQTGRKDSLPKFFNYMRDGYRLMERMDSFCTSKKINDPLVKELMFHAKTGFVYYERAAQKKPVSRDEIMGERINFHAADPSAKIIVWAHSAHIARYAWLEDEVGMMGATVVKQFPKDYFAIGLSGGTGSYSYINVRAINADHDFRDTLFHADYLPVAPGSWNQQLSTIKPAAFLVNFAKLSAFERVEWEKPRTIKMLGYNKEKGEQNYYPVSLPQMFDALIFVKETHHTTALF